MTLAPRFLIDFLARYRAGRLRHRLRLQGNGAADQQAMLQYLLRHLQRTEFGRQHGITAGMRYEDFRMKVPLRATSDFRPWTERMAGGAADVLWPGRCRHFVYTAGAVDGAPKMLPATPDLLAHFHRALSDAMLLACARSGSVALFHGRHLHVGASTALMSAHGAAAGYLDGVVGMALTAWVRENLYSPGAELAQLPEGADKIDAIARAFATRDVRVIAGSPPVLTALLDQVRRQPGGADAWPHLACCVHTGAPLGISGRDLVTRLGPRVMLHEVYAAAEGFFAAQDGDNGMGLRLLTDTGVFFEFLPLHDLLEGNLRQLGPQCVPLERAQPGLEYALVVTTPGGLCRCVLGDAVRLVSSTPPRLILTGRTELLLRTFGEQVTERELTETLLDVCARNEWDALNFHVAPYLTRRMPRTVGYHEWWVELRPGTVRTPTGPVIAPELDQELSRRNRDYARRRAHGNIEPPQVRLVMPGTFAQWAGLHPTFGGPGKLARCRNDRLIADQLAGITRFYSSTIPPFRPA